MREELASLQHDIWSQWMRYMFKVCESVTDGSILIPVDKVKKWTRQMTTSYRLLHEVEKENSREQSDKVLNLINQQEDN